MQEKPWACIEGIQELDTATSSIRRRNQPLLRLTPNLTLQSLLTAQRWPSVGRSYGLFTIAVHGNTTPRRAPRSLAAGFHQPHHGILT
eukprot:scaffold3828_cov267-Pinguiococcus_pyrenoidosus.AAC.3